MKRINCYNIWFVYRVLIFQIYVKGNLVGNEICCNIFGWRLCIKSGRMIQTKGKWLYFFSRFPIVKVANGYFKCKKIFQCSIALFAKFNIVVISSTLFSAYSNSFYTFICRRVSQRDIMQSLSCSYAAQLRHAIRGRGLIWSGNVDCDITLN